MRDGHGAAVDTTTAAGKLVFGIFAALAEFEARFQRGVLPEDMPEVHLRRPADTAGIADDLADLAARVSNWGRWGKDDQRGMLNLITPEKTKANGRT